MGFGGQRALSSVGSEHLPYKQGVAGSNPAGPTFALRSFSEEGIAPRPVSNNRTGFFYIRASVGKAHSLSFEASAKKGSHPVQLAIIGRIYLYPGFGGQSPPLPFVALAKKGSNFRFADQSQTEFHC